MTNVENEVFWSTFLQSFSLITASEMGDKTFFMTSIMSMNGSKQAVFLGSMAALSIMNVLSSHVYSANITKSINVLWFFSIVFIGTLTTNISPTLIHITSILLFLFSGLKMVFEGDYLKSEF